MISAWWLLAALWIGAAGGYIAAAMVFVGGRQRTQEKEEPRMEGEGG